MYFQNYAIRITYNVTRMQIIKILFSCLKTIAKKKLLKYYTIFVLYLLWVTWFKQQNRGKKREIFRYFSYIILESK